MCEWLTKHEAFLFDVVLSWSVCGWLGGSGLYILLVAGREYVFGDRRWINRLMGWVILFAQVALLIALPLFLLEFAYSSACE